MGFAVYAGNCDCHFSSYEHIIKETDADYVGLSVLFRVYSQDPLVNVGCMKTSIPVAWTEHPKVTQTICFMCLQISISHSLHFRKIKL